MSEPVNVTSLKTIFSFPFKGKGWGTRFFIGVLIILAGLIIPIIPLIFVGGYLLEVMRRAARGEELVLPEWHEWGKLFVDGLKSILISLILLLPGTLVMAAGWAFYMSSIFSIAFLSNTVSNGRNIDAIIAPIILTALSVFFLSLVIGPLLIALGAIPLPVAAANMAAEGKLAGAFHIRKWWPALWHNKLGYFIAFTVFLGLGSIIYFVATVINAALLFLCCLIVPLLTVPAGFYLALVYAALFGDTYRQSMEPASPPVEGEPGPVEPESLEAAVPVEETPAPTAEEPPAVQPPEAAEPPVEEPPAPAPPQVQDPDLTVIHKKETPPAPETPA
jgi:hypothetical protein